jgi:hypothetical protein
MKPETDLYLPEGMSLREQARVYSTVKACLMFQDGGNRRVPDEKDHTRVINFVLANKEREDIVCSLISRDITEYDEIMAALVVADAHHSTMRSGIL